MKRRILIDTDIALGIPERDVDDGLAIVMANNSDDILIDGITLTYGNASLDEIDQAMQALLKQTDNWQFDIARGATSDQDLGKETDATKQLVNKLKESKATIVAIGPFTNIATALKIAPEIKANIEEIIVVAGRQPGQRFLTGNHKLSHPDLNFERDPEAMQCLIDEEVKIVMAPYEVSSKVWFTEAVLKNFVSNKTGLSTYLEKHCRNWLNFWNETFSTELYPVEGFNPFDCLAVAWLTDKDLLSWAPVDLRIEEADYDRTDSTFQGTESSKKKYLHARFLDRDANSRFTYIYDVEREMFLDRLCQKLK